MFGPVHIPALQPAAGGIGENRIDAMQAAGDHEANQQPEKYQGPAAGCKPLPSEEERATLSDRFKLHLENSLANPPESRAAF
jgi:hypothetical protein